MKCKHKKYRILNGKKYRVVCPSCAGEIRGMTLTAVWVEEQE